MAATQSHLLVNIFYFLSSRRFFIIILYTLMLGKIYILLLSSSLLNVYSHFIRGCFLVSEEFVKTEHWVPNCVACSYGMLSPLFIVLNKYSMMVEEK
ncbi:hypothetical protein N665_0361s0002 [Sinapis alba]|nr:hypothetical protein N665_0361s0002 [Sinapis alba]